jgi:hypothetical protein
MLPPAPGFALDDELLAQHLGHLQGAEARDRVGATARRERNEDADRLVRPRGLPDRRTGEGGDKRGGCGQLDEPAPIDHVSSRL